MLLSSPFYCAENFLFFEFLSAEEAKTQEAAAEQDHRAGLGDFVITRRYPTTLGSITFIGWDALDMSCGQERPRSTTTMTKAIRRRAQDIKIIND